MTRRMIPTAALLALVPAGCSSAPPAAVPEAPPPPPTVASLTQRPIIGALGLPLGTYAEIGATVVAGSDLRRKQYDGQYLLRVTAVDGRPLADPPIMEFSVPGFITAGVATDSFDLHKLKTGAKTGRLDAAEIAKLEAGYVGQQVRLIVYETGGYSGMPRDLPPDVPTWQDHGFGFSTQLIVLGDRP